MALRTRPGVLLITIPFLVLASREFDAAPESDLEDIRQAAANLHKAVPDLEDIRQEILKEKQSLAAIDINRFQSSFAPSLGAVGWADSQKQALAAIDINRVPSGSDPSLGAVGWADLEKQVLPAIDINRVPSGFDPSLGAVGWADSQKQALAAIDINRLPSSFDPSLGSVGWAGPEKQALAAIDINRVPTSLDPSLFAAGWADPGKQALAAIGMNRLPRRFVPSLGEVGWVDPENELQLAARQQLQQAVEHQRLLEREGPTIATERLASQLTFEQLKLATEVALEQLQLTTERLASQRRLASAQLEQTGLLWTPSERSANRLPKQPLALPQTASQHKNPAFAALLLEPVLYGYSAVVWALMVLFTGVASAVGLYISKSIALWRTENLQLPTAGDTGRQFSNDVSARLHAQDEGDVESIESWIKVPMHIASQSRRQDCQGYPHDEFDGEGGSFPMPTTGRHHPCGYVDEN